VDAWEKVSETLVHRGHLPIVARRFRTPDGIERTTEVKLEGETVAILALTPEREVVLARQYRPGPEETLLELPGGGIEDGESPLEAARRELLEETGYAGELREAGSLFDCAYSTRVRHVAVALDARPVSEPQPEEGEFTEVVLLSLDAFRKHLRQGRLTDVGIGYRALDALSLL
jgi:ADP-ribose pyrophosphatase